MAKATAKKKAPTARKAKPKAGAKPKASGRKPAAKPVARAAPKPKPKPKPKKPKRRKFDAKTLRAIKGGLEVQREELTAQLAEIEEEAFMATQSEISGEVGYDEDYADAGSATFEREKDLSIVNNVLDLLDKINKALHKIEEGTYGICEVCGNPIEAARLKALPHVLLCIKDKRAEERR